ncbi:class I SAM-dependent methyltransferase [Mechercharimyces sp. CAU 1602]|uniref:class I SAM-dependent methyltransferase n=1 Tax=Mechercharimyces sp. CAU 1602 TaxID=2973933 RepID=UPI002161FB67|nr:class I SAM-dependent methyltransferase [Mechercharimyces sp. CAU 1602]MCS1351783.1 class I SAM-dependent methyltransferase [Mechercharimyces sp. CAU 1602]
MSPWYEKSFGEDYLLVYRHRDQVHASKEIDAICTWMELGGGETVLDLCCGTGRHSIELAHKGLHVTGMDLSTTLLRHGRRCNQHENVHYVQGDMRKVPFADHSFDAVMNLFTSFGYFIEDHENSKVLTEIKRVLKPGGKFVIDFLNRYSVEKHLIPESRRQEEDTLIVEERKIEGPFVHKKITVTDNEGTRTYQERVKMYTRDEMVQMMGQAGLAIDAVYGDYEGKMYKEESARMIFVGTAR